MAALSRGFYINFVSLVLQKVATGFINEVAALTKIKSMRWDSMENMFGLSRPGHNGLINEVAAKWGLTVAICVSFWVLYVTLQKNRLAIKKGWVQENAIQMSNPKRWYQNEATFSYKEAFVHHGGLPHVIVKSNAQNVQVTKWHKVWYEKIFDCIEGVVHNRVFFLKNIAIL